ncbi:MAG: aminodeoxychorismate synthase component I [Desulfobacterales bacterium]|nr:aminodeoxychorismate synthase component I [Desulfobacterales bacterium]
MDRIKRTTGSLEGLHIENIVIPDNFMSFAARFASEPGTVVLMSGGDLDCARYHVLAAKPWLVFTSKGNNISVAADDQNISIESEPLDILNNILNLYKEELSFHLSDNNVFLPEPVASGLFGYLSYDLKDRIEILPGTTVDDLYLPDIYFTAPAIIVIHDKKKKKTTLCISKRNVSGKNTLDDDLRYFNKKLSRPIVEYEGFSGDPEGFKSGFSKTEYMDSVHRIREYISSGHVYQVNMSQRFEMDFSGDTFDLFKTLYEKNPAPFFAYINTGDHQVVSTSPERFVKQTGKDIETRPIKGTRPRGKTVEQDEKQAKGLLKSKKDDAELSMIVDLLRNDMGKVCIGGSVKVVEHKRLEAYQNVYHLVSIIEGRLQKDKDSVDLINAAFPGGSITGCPKIRAMEIIDELETHRRHIYTGSIGYISFHETMDLSIAIRTATILNNKIVFSVGGGVVFDSDPEDEYEETLHKGQTLTDVFKGKEKKPLIKNMAWINGKIKPVNNVTIPVADPGFQYGYGFFETIRVNNGKPKYLEEHIDRLCLTWKSLFFQDPPDISWNEIINNVINQNNLQKNIAAVKIMVSKGDREKAPFNRMLIVTAKPYINRLYDESKSMRSGIELLIYPKPRQTPLANHKTLNYLYYFLAGRWAIESGADEAIILNPDGSISETNTANIIIIKGKIAITPTSPSVLPGIMEKAVINLLCNWGYQFEKRILSPEDLYSADSVLMTNSLMGAVPVLRINNKSLSPSTELCEKINDIVL